MPRAATLECAEYSHDKLLNIIRKGIGLVGEGPKKGQRVLLKVNLLYGAEPMRVVNTNPVLVGAVIDAVKAMGCSVSVGDSPAIAGFHEAAEKSGIARVCTEKKAKLVELGEPVEAATEGTLVRRLKLSRRLEDFDYIINLPKLKTHSLTGFTGAVKNTFGFVPGREKGLYHLRFKKPEHFAMLLYDICRHVKPGLTIMDAVYAMEGTGPGQGSPRKLGRIIVSDSPFAADIAAMRLIGFGKEENLVTRVCEGAWTGYTELGDAADRPIAGDFKRAARTGRLDILWSIINSFGGLATLKPHAEKSCIGCGDCARACPAKAIRIDGRAVIDRGRCILCHCCHEVCRYSSMSLRCSLPGRLLRRIFL